MKFLYWYLPYDIRRLLYKIIYPSHFKSYQDQRKIVDKSGFSLKPYDDLKCIFIHIPKCAGLSVCKSLFGNLGGGHIMVRDYQIVYKKSEFQDYFKFTFVRNPWDRLVSAYHYLREGGFNSSDEIWAKNNLLRYKDFDDFTRNWVNRDNIYSMLHFIPQHNFVCLPNRLEPVVDYIGRLENIKNDFDYIKQRLGISTELIHYNDSQSRVTDYKTYYTQETIEIVATAYKEDIKLFNYTFDNS